MTGFIRVAAITPEVALANPQANGEALLQLAFEAAQQGASVVVAPELSLTGATCGDLFLNHALLAQTQHALQTLAQNLPEQLLLICGLPLYVENQLFNCAAVLQKGRILGYIPRETFSRSDTRIRCFSPAHALSTNTLTDGTPIGTDLLFTIHDLTLAVTFGLTPHPTSAHLLACLDAAPEGVGKAAKRRRWAQTLSESTGASVLYTAAGKGESSTDGVYSGHRLIAWEGRLLAETCWAPGLSLADLSPTWIDAHRLRTAPPSAPATRSITVDLHPLACDGAFAKLRANPFLPEDPAEIPARCAEILAIQVQALARRFQQIRAKRLVLGLSGGLDSTLALVVCSALCQQLGLPPETVLAVTMPGFGTSDRTYNNACTLAQTLGAELREISIVPCVTQHFSDIGQDPETHDITYENAQARARTWLLMDIANKEGGLLVGTGDLSEIALGWSTYNGDHMSMYSVNCSVPKTLIPHCLEAAAETFGLDETTAATLQATLKDICETPVSPELVPGVQHTESIVGRYELHDCFLWYFMRYGCDRKQLAELAKLLFREIPEAERVRTLDIFCRRVITQQFKRSCSPDGPAVGGIALSPRGGWMLPSDANLTL